MHYTLNTHTFTKAYKYVQLTCLSVTLPPPLSFSGYPTLVPIIICLLKLWLLGNYKHTFT